MNDQTIAGDALNNQIWQLYGQLLLDKNLIFAVILAWAITHFLKQAPFINKLKPIGDRRWFIRLFSVFIGLMSVLFFKRHQLDTHADEVINLAVLVAFVHPVLYRSCTAIMDKFAPSISASLKSK